MENKPDILKALNPIETQNVQSPNGSVTKRKSLEDLIKEDIRSPLPGIAFNFIKNLIAYKNKSSISTTVFVIF